MPFFSKKRIKNLTKLVNRSVDKAIANSFPELVPKEKTIPDDVIALFEAFDSKDGNYSEKAIITAVKKLSDKSLKELYESVNWDSETGQLLSKKITKKYGLKSADTKALSKGELPGKFDARKCLYEKELYRDWFESIRKIHCCCCCHRKWPVIYPYPICKYCWRCKMVKIYHSGGSFYAHSLEFSNNFNVNENPLRRAEIDVIGGGTPGPVNWSDINFTGSNLLDIANRPHASLTDAGTQTHAQIDSHLSTNSAHGTTGSVVGDTDTQTLSNKTLTSPVINNTISGSALKDDATFTTVTSDTIASTASIKSYVDNAVAGSSGGGAAINDAVTNLTETWSSQKMSDTMKVVKGEYFGGPAYAAGTPFRFNINGLGAGLDPTNVFVDAKGFKTDTAGNLLGPLKIEWNVVLDGANLVAEFVLKDENDVLFQNPGAFGPWNACNVKLSFYAKYCSDTQTAVFLP